MSRLDELLKEWEERLDSGRSATPEELCPDDAELRAKLAERIRRIEAFRWFEADDTPAVPEQIGQYEVRRRLGGGGMGVVYLARHPVLNKDVAVKLVSPDQLAAHGERAKERFRNEGQALARWEHPNIVAVHDAGFHEGCPYLVMEYVPGGSLNPKQFAGDGAAVAALMAKVARAVHYAHTHDGGTLHRDLKPANILLAKNGEPKVADFGLAKLLAPAAPDATKVDAKADTSGAGGLTTVGGPQPGTRKYMAPELTGVAASVASDIWSLGVTLHELLTGADLTPGVPPASAIERAVPGRLGRQLAEIVDRCLRPVPGERYATAADLADALEGVRPRSRRGVWVAAILAAGLATAAGYLARSRTPANLGAPPVEAVDPDLEGYTNPDAVKKALAKLARGEPVTLIDRGRPESYRLNLGPSTGNVLDGELPETTAHATNSFCAVELLPYLPPGEWVVEARIRQKSSQIQGTVGAFVAAHRARGIDGWECSLCAVTFNNFTPPDPKRGPVDRAALRAVLGREPTRSPYPDAHEEIETWGVRVGRPPPPDPHAPRTVRFSVTPEVLGASLDARPFRPCREETYLRARAARFGELRPYTPPAGNGRGLLGGVGVYARYSEVAAETFTVSPRGPQ